LRAEPVDLAEVATEVVEQLRPQAGQRHLGVSADGACAVAGDRDRLKQLVANLVENAIRYTPAGGRIDVAVGCLQHAARTARLPTTRDTDMVLLSVRDTGIGISPSDLPHVFERFYRADKARSRAHGGSGLGLSIAAYIAQVHGGSIEALSDGPNRGSTFRVWLPRLAAPSEPGLPSASLSLATTEANS
jgi:signal transduction histidine kinase